MSHTCTHFYLARTCFGTLVFSTALCVCARVCVCVCPTPTLSFSLAYQSVSFLLCPARDDARSDHDVAEGPAAGPLALVRKVSHALRKRCVPAADKREKTATKEHSRARRPGNAGRSARSTHGENAGSRYHGRALGEESKGQERREGGWREREREKRLKNDNNNNSNNKWRLSLAPHSRPSCPLN